ncbi:MAG: hypothetical protein ACK44F_04760 [Roseococcus sp.]|jgi:hypothetical protein
MVRHPPLRRRTPPGTPRDGGLAARRPWPGLPPFTLTPAPSAAHIRAGLAVRGGRAGIARGEPA